MGKRRAGRKEGRKTSETKKSGGGMGGRHTSTSLSLSSLFMAMKQESRSERNSTSIHCNAEKETKRRGRGVRKEISTSTTSEERRLADVKAEKGMKEDGDWRRRVWAEFAKISASAPGSHLAVRCSHWREEIARKPISMIV